ncbi:MAG: hypothetical protein J6X02_01845 [Bacilli bacterium]|nr:hypothetical protein [Bacilli bacterium]
MNEENKENLTNSNLDVNSSENNIEMPEVKTEKSVNTEATPQSAPAPAEPAPQNPLDKTIETKRVIPTPVQAAPATNNDTANKEVGTVVVGRPMSNIVKPIPVGDIQGSGPVATVGGGTNIEPKKKNNIVSIIVLIVAVLVLIGIILFRFVFNGNINLGGGLKGTVQGNTLIYKGVKKGEKINFEITDKLKLVLTIDELEVQDGVGTKVTCSIREADGKDSVTLTNRWLEDDNQTIKLDYNKIGDYAVINNSVLTSELSVISPDGTLTRFNDMSSFVNEEKGLVINFSSVTSSEIQIEATRATGMGSIVYGDLKTEIDYDKISENEDEMSKYSRYSLGDGFIMCIDDISKLPETTTINALFTFKLVDGKIDLTKPEVSDKVDFKTYYETNKDTEC